MPGLMNTRKEFGTTKPFKGVRIMGSLHMQTAVLIKILCDLGADIRWCLCIMFSSQDHAAAAGVANRTSKCQGVRLEGRDPPGVLVVHPPGPHLALRRGNPDDC